MRTLPLLLLLGVLVAACDSGETDLAVAGSYEATVFEAPIGDATVDVLEAGGAYTATLNADGSASGRILVPESLRAGGAEGDEEILFNGTYTVSSAIGELRFEHDEDTFVRDLRWVVGDGELVANWSTGAEVRLVKR